MLDLRRQGLQVDTKSTATDMVTHADRASEAHIVEAIRAARPGDGFIGEEGTSEPGETGVQWLIDPIDGTTNYIYGAHGFAVSIAAQVDGLVVAGAVHDCILGEHFTGVRGRGAWLDGQPITASTETVLARALVSTGFGYRPERRVAQAEALARVIGKVRDIRRRGGAAVDLCWLGCGRSDAYYEVGLGPWDLAAGRLIAEEAGAVCIGGPGELMAGAAPGVAEEFFALLAEARVADV